MSGLVRGGSTPRARGALAQRTRVSRPLRAVRGGSVVEPLTDSATIESASEELAEDVSPEELDASEELAEDVTQEELGVSSAAIVALLHVRRVASTSSAASAQACDASEELVDSTSLSSTSSESCARAIDHAC